MNNRTRLSEGRYRACGFAGLILFLASLLAGASDLDRYRDASHYVTTGTVNGLTLLIDFPDDQSVPAYNAAAMNNMMTQVGFPGFGGVGYPTVGSLRDYFRIASRQRFDYIGSVFNFSTNYNNGGGSNGFYRASLSKTNYGVGHGAAFLAVISNALAAAKLQGFDFSTLTTDSHSNVVGLTVLYANTNTPVYGPAGQAVDWCPPTNGSSPFFTADGVGFRWYAISTVGRASAPYWPEINMTSHECAHMLAGWTDMDSRTQTGCGDGSFCLMSSGGGGNVQNPPLPSAYLRSQIGWIDIVDIYSNTPPQEVVLTSARTICYRYKNPNNTNEFFLVELRDSFDVGAMGYALAIWHVDVASPYLSGYYTVNTATQHCRCVLMQADNKLDLENSANNGTLADLFFSPNPDRFDDYTAPAAHWWNGSNSCFALGQISRRSQALRFCVNPLVLNANQTVRGVVGSPFSYLVQRRAGINFTLTADSLPAGLALVGNAITGTPTSAGTTTVTLVADTGINCYSYPLTLKLVAGAAPVIDSPLNITVAFPGCFLRYAITAAGAEPITYAYTNGPTPPHNTLLSGGVFSNGTFSGMLMGVGTFTNNLAISVSNAFGCDTQLLNIALSYYQAPGVTNGAALPATGQVGTAYHFAFAYADDPAPVFAVTAGALPSGLSLSYDGVLSGTPMAAGSYTGVITAGNTYPSVFTQAFAMTIVAPPVIILNPVSQTHHVGALASFSVAATGTAPLYYQWQKDETNRAGASATNYVLNSVALSDAGAYRCVVTNSAGATTSAVATLSVNVPTPTLTSTPEPTRTATPLPTVTPTVSVAPTSSPTSTPTSTSTATPTSTAVATPLPTPTATLAPSLDVPADVNASLGFFTDKVLITWARVTNATGYEVLRHVTNDVLSVTRTNPIDGMTTTQYHDTAATQDLLYYYWVRATNASGKSAVSSHVIGWRAMDPTPTALPTVLPTATPWVTGTPTLSPTPLPTPTVVATATLNPWVTATPTPVVTALPGLTPTPTPSPMVTSVVTVTPGPGATPMPTPGPASGFASLAVYEESQGLWHVLRPGTFATHSVILGGRGFMPVPADYDADGHTDYAVYSPASGIWMVMLSGQGNAGVSAGFGGSDDAPVPQDYDGDNKADLAIYQAATGEWRVLLSGSDYAVVILTGFGNLGVNPTPGDYDGDNRADPGLYSPSIALWSVMLSAQGYLHISASFGGHNYRACPADFDGDRRMDPAIYSETTGLWIVMKSGSGYALIALTLGGPGFVAVPCDIDGDGKADYAVYQQSTGLWAIALSGSGYALASTYWGGPDFAPVGAMR